ncbi:MAG: hypothetical protein ACYDG6_06930 [Thermincolia bacterium]
MSKTCEAAGRQFPDKNAAMDFLREQYCSEVPNPGKIRCRCDDMDSGIILSDYFPVEGFCSTRCVDEAHQILIKEVSEISEICDANK